MRSTSQGKGTKKRTTAVVLAGLLVALSLGAAAPQSAGPAGRDKPVARAADDTTGTVLRVKVHGKSLEGNLEGDSPDRDVSVYLPPGYKSHPHRRYPVMYMLHGFTNTDLSYFGDDPIADLDAIADRTIGNGTARDMIIVTPNAMTVYGGSNYSSGATTGDWETFVSQELVSYVDRRFRTVPKAKARGLAGHSMGGYGAMRIGMKHPGVFSSLYIMSSCCIDAKSNIPSTPAAMAAFEAFQERPDDYTEVPQNIRTAVAAAAAWAPNPDKPPLYYDSPVRNGELQEPVIARMTTNRPLAMVDQYVNNLRKQHIAFDVGDQDTNIRANLTEFDRILTSYDVPHSFEVYPGNHVSGIPDRLEHNVLPFFAKHLAKASGR
ncbi:alpha/beta hydrolase [Streptomyces sp. TRM68416]|uniref:alpha/beta hydrolase n=1 Tax=Streptomyces sp. TRM68416 TaxID=2758412 RepID=UPI0016620AC8|nr:alpha/beta hydrolase-fold protein [Streptomyces sp. TRM68416]MBD0843973.1 esterase [Streptomyces sp. TRM68416]